MTGSIVSGIDYSLLFNYSDDSSTTASLLNTIYGTGGSATTNTGPQALSALNLAQKNETTDIAQEAKQPAVARDIAAFQSALASAKTPAQLLQNPAALKVLLTANGLGDQAAYPALAQKVLLSDPSDSNSLVNQINATDTAWLPVVQTYDFASKGLSVLQNPQVQSTLTNAYAEVLWRQSLDATTPGLSNALTFIQTASTLTSADAILGNSTARTVVQTAFNIPAQIAFQSIQAQEQAINSNVDIAKLQDPTYVQGIAQQYLLNAASAASSSGTTPTLDQLAVQAQGLVV
jgi:hypothetical protein